MLRRGATSKLARERRCFCTQSFLSCLFLGFTGPPPLRVCTGLPRTAVPVPGGLPPVGPALAECAWSQVCGWASGRAPSSDFYGRTPGSVPGLCSREGSVDPACAHSPHSAVTIPKSLASVDQRVLRFLLPCLITDSASHPAVSSPPARLLGASGLPVYMANVPTGSSAQRVCQGGSPGSCWPLLDSWGLWAERELSRSDLLTLELSGHQQACLDQMPAESVSQSERDGLGGCKCPRPLLGILVQPLSTPQGVPEEMYPGWGLRFLSGHHRASPSAVPSPGVGETLPATTGSSRSIFNFLSLSRAQGSGPLALGIGFQASPSGLMAQVIQPG